MHDDIRAALKPLAERIGVLRGHLDIDGKARRSEDLDRQAGHPGFWDDPAIAQAILKEKGQLERTVNDWHGLSRAVDDITTLVDLAEEMGDPGALEEARNQLERLDGEVKSLETRRLLSQEHDSLAAIIEINAGAGGTDAADWAQMLQRMYIRWGERRGFEIEILDEQLGEDAGIRSATLAIRGPYAFGYLQGENGVHRLVRISPFDLLGRRQTAFASVAIYPEIDDTIEIVINPADIEMETMRASGAGGQHVNTTDSAVRLRHLPTGIAVLCRAERSQHKNRDKAMKMLKAKLFQRELDIRNAAKDVVNAKKKKIDFGSQIRSYVLQPYQQAKDHRTDEALTDVEAVLDGHLMPFLESWLAARAEGSL
ncbi:MAG: peptide chain release factor 2 [Deltaproteobacteria bacterium]|nr:peptide chain release factor 2 [Deltaproteobacteria bacterium]